ncbi:MAG: DinB family protein [Gemmatirosa sp.]
MSTAAAPAAAPAAVPLTPDVPLAVAVTPDALREHWQGHRRLTRRLIVAFPDDQLFTFSVGGMRTFGMLALELLSMAAPMVRGAATSVWETSFDRAAVPKDELLRQWDASTQEMDALWPQIPAARFQETMTAFGQYTSPLYDLLLYCIDNEVHHRGQGYVYLRALGVEPPPFWER